MELTPSFIRHHIIGTTLRHCMDVQSYDVMSGSCMGYVYIDTDTMEPVQYGPAPAPALAFAYSRFMESVISELHGMEPIQECEGCMAGYHPSLLTVRESGSVMCQECCDIEDGD